jgi:uncharacterized membrane protein HdeD (DUF308 family)
VADLPPIPDYESPGHPPERRAALGIASLAIALVMNILGATCMVDVLEALTFQFYFYGVIFIIGLALAIASLVRPELPRWRAVVALVLNLYGLAWSCWPLYLAMRRAAAAGWMKMPWPL